MDFYRNIYPVWIIHMAWNFGLQFLFHQMPNPIEIKDHDYENVSTWCGNVTMQLRHALIRRITILSMYFLGMPINLAHCNFLFWLQYTQVLYSEAVCVLFSINKQCLRFFQKLLLLRSFNRFENDKKKSLELRCDLFENSKMVWQENIEMPIYNRSYHMSIDGGWNFVCPTNKLWVKMTGKKSFVIQIICDFFIYFVHMFNRRTC